MKNISILITFLLAAATLHAQTTCSGTPTAGTATGCPLACGASSLSLSLTGSTTASGLTYQWQYSNDSSTWINLVGGTTSSYSFTPTGSYYYQCLVTCSGATSTSTAINIGYEPSCPCTPAYANANPGDSYAMTAFSVTGYGGTSINDPYGTNASGYLDRSCSVVPVSFYPGNSYSWTLNINMGASSYWEAQIWLDFNNDGTFATSEAITNVVGPAGSTSSLCSGASSTSDFIAIPSTALSGIHRMRVREAYTGGCTISEQMNPCNSSDATGINYNYGNTFDYAVNIMRYPFCAGAPEAGAASPSTYIACPSSSLTLSLSGSSSASKLTYQWQSSPDSATWSNLSGGTTEIFNYSPTGNAYYRCEVTCTVSGITSYSAGVQIAFESSCPCNPPIYINSGPGLSYSMTNFYISGYGGTSISDAYGTNASGYLDRSGSVSPVYFYPGNIYSWSLYNNTTSEYWEVQIWIDFNDDGMFATSETVQSAVGPGGSETTMCTNTSNTSGTLSISPAATSGLHRLRVREAYTYSGSGTAGCSVSANMDPCNSSDGTNYYYYGNTFDYAAHIIGTGATTSTPAINSNPGVEIYPNPANTLLNIKIDNASSYNSLTITNTLGEVLIQQPVTALQTNINVNTLPAGVYYIFLKGENGITIRKFLKM